MTRIYKTSHDVEICERRKRVGKSGRSRDVLMRLVVARDPMCWNENLENLESGLRRKEKTSTMHDEYREND